MHNLLKFSFRQHVPCILQSEAAECGLACLAMILGYYKHQIDLVSLRQRHFPSANGISLRSLIEIANHCNLASRPLRLELASLTELQTPCILHWDMNHFVVLVKVKRNTVIINDPAIGKRALKLKELGEHFTGVAVETVE